MTSLIPVVGDNPSDVALSFGEKVTDGVSTVFDEVQGGKTGSEAVGDYIVDKLNNKVDAAVHAVVFGPAAVVVSPTIKNLDANISADVHLSEDRLPTEETTLWSIFLSGMSSDGILTPSSLNEASRAHVIIANEIVQGLRNGLHATAQPSRTFFSYFKKALNELPEDVKTTIGYQKPNVARLKQSDDAVDTFMTNVLNEIVFKETGCDSKVFVKWLCESYIKVNDAFVAADAELAADRNEALFQLKERLLGSFRSEYAIYAGDIHHGDVRVGSLSQQGSVRQDSVTIVTLPDQNPVLDNVKNLFSQKDVTLQTLPGSTQQTAPVVVHEKGVDFSCVKENIQKELDQKNEKEGISLVAPPPEIPSTFTGKFSITVGPIADPGQRARIVAFLAKYGWNQKYWDEEIKWRSHKIEKRDDWFQRNLLDTDSIIAVQEEKVKKAKERLTRELTEHQRTQSNAYPVCDARCDVEMESAYLTFLKERKTYEPQLRVQTGSKKLTDTEIFQKLTALKEMGPLCVEHIETHKYKNDCQFCYGYRDTAMEYEYLKFLQNEKEKRPDTPLELMTDEEISRRISLLQNTMHTAEKKKEKYESGFFKFTKKVEHEIGNARKPQTIVAEQELYCAVATIQLEKLQLELKRRHEVASLQIVVEKSTSVTQEVDKPAQASTSGPKEASLEQDKQEHRFDGLELADKVEKVKEQVLEGGLKESEEHRSIADIAKDILQPGQIEVSSGGDSSFPSVSAEASSKVFYKPSGQMCMHAPVSERQGLSLNAQSHVSELFGHGPLMPGKFESNGQGGTHFVFDDPQTSNFSIEALRVQRKALAPQRKEPSSSENRPAIVMRESSMWEDAQHRSDEAIIQSLELSAILACKVVKFGVKVAKVLAISGYVVTKKSIRGTYELFSGDHEFLHNDKVKVHKKALEGVLGVLQHCRAFSPTGGAFRVLAHRWYEGQGKRVNEIQRQFAVWSAHVICMGRLYSQEQALHDRQEKKTGLYRVSFKEEITTANKTFIPAFIAEVSPHVEGIQQTEEKIVDLLKKEFIATERSKCGAEFTRLAQVIPELLRKNIENYSLYEEGLQDLARETYEFSSTSPAFRSLARYYMYELVHAIQDGPLKDEFLSTEGSKQFRTSLWDAYTKFEQSEKLLVEARAEHNAKNIFVRAWRTVFNNKPLACKVAMEEAEKKLMNLLRRLHLNVLRQQLEEPSNDPLSVPKADLRALLAGNDIADEERRSRAQFLLPALSRFPLYVQADGLFEGYDERKWLTAWIPQKLFFGTCESPDSRAACIIEMRH